MGRDVSEEEMQSMMGNMGDILIDHLFFRPPDVVLGPGSISALQAHRLNLPDAEGIRYPVALSFSLSVPAQCDAASRPRPLPRLGKGRTPRPTPLPRQGKG